MVTNILLERQAALSTGVLTLQVDREIEINVPAEEAQRKVSRFVRLEISTQMHAEAPLLVVGDKVAWRVPIHLTFPAFGNVGCVGVIHVDPTTGELDTFEENIILRTEDGRLFVLAEIDDFDREIELVRQNEELMQFLEERSKDTEKLTFDQVRQQLNL